jgi:hypothetical protein
MPRVLVVFSTGLLNDLAERPGRNKLEKEKGATPRLALQKILERLSRDIQKEAPKHMKADVFSQSIDILRLYTPETLAILLSNFQALITVPAKSGYCLSQPDGYLVKFCYSRLNWCLLSAYLEVDGVPVLVLLKAAETTALESIYNRIASRVTEFDSYFKLAEHAANVALDNQALDT